MLIDIGIPGDHNIRAKEIEKIAKYVELKIEVARLWGIPESRVKVLPVVTGAVGFIPHNLTTYLQPYNGKGSNSTIVMHWGHCLLPL